jgi:FkbM family methyltransferase
VKLLRNALTLFSRPSLAGDYIRFRLSQARHSGEFVRSFPAEKLLIGGLSGFSEYHSCARFTNTAERLFLTRFPFGDGPVLDVGGNLGLFSLLMAHRFADRTIHAFEPNPSTFKVMRANFARNGCLFAFAHPQAVAAHDGEVSFQANPVDRATTHIVSENQYKSLSSQSPAVQVSCVTLDSFIESHSIENVGLLKVDVEGYEEVVFRGAGRLLSSGSAKTVYYEVCPELTSRAGFAPDAPSRQLIAHGYKLHFLDDEGRLQPADVASISSVTLENWVATWNGSVSS